MTRREFLCGSIGYIVAPEFPQKWEFLHANTGERSRLGRENQQELRWLLRDWRHPDVPYTASPRLIDLIFRVLEEFDGPFVIFSGFRTPSTNRLVGGARRSQHLKARAVDFMIPNSSVERIGEWLYTYKTGGIGLYSTHIHMDTGRFRTWRHL